MSIGAASSLDFIAAFDVAWNYIVSNSHLLHI